MSDTLKSKLFTSMFSTAHDFFNAKISDNHGNSLENSKLTCSGRTSSPVEASELAVLQMRIWTNAIPNLVGVSHAEEVPVLGGMASPLKLECDRIIAQSQLSPTPSKRTK